jgi:FlaA1/EpsC-like NDP-sugar epimerase
MVKLFNVHFSRRTLRLFVVESLLLVSALLFPIFLHFGTSLTSALMSDYRIWKIGTVAGICLLFLYCNNLYSLSSLEHREGAHSRFLRALGLASVALGLLYCIFPSIELYRGFSIIGVSLAAVLLITNRAAFIARESTRQQRKPIVILGEGSLAKLIARAIEERADLNFQVAGYVGDGWKDSSPPC